MRAYNSVISEWATRIDTMIHNFLPNTPFEFGFLMRIATAWLWAAVAGEGLWHFARLPCITGVDPQSNEHRTLSEAILATLDKIESHAMALKADEACAALRQDVLDLRCDAALLRREWQDTGSLSEVVQKQCQRWRT